MAETFTPYSTVKPFFDGKPPGFVSDDDIERVQAYQTYEEMYWSESVSGIEIEDGNPIRVPTAKIIIEAIHRFLAVGWDYNVIGADADVLNVNLAFTKLFKREQLKAKVSSAKRFGLIRGDAMLHIVADPNKLEGSRISIEELDPGSYFPIYELDDPSRIIGCHIVDQLIMPGGEDVVARRQTYRKVMDANGLATGAVTSEIGFFALDAWDDRFGKEADVKQLSSIEPEAELPVQITSLPVYHWKNTRNPSDFFGSSAMRGIERLLKAVDQTITDEDIALALASLGVYATDSGEPDGGWIIGPARVVNLKTGSEFKRVPGITSVQPSQDHADYLEGKARAGAGVPSIAAGDVDTASAESGIALTLKMMPLMAANAERELEIISVLDHMLYDLQTMWFPAYEMLNFGEAVVVESIIDEAMPTNRRAVIDEVISLIESGLITMKMAIDRLAELGWDYPEDAITTMLQDSANRVKVTDPFSARLVMRDEMGAANKQTKVDVKAATDAAVE